MGKKAKADPRIAPMITTTTVKTREKVDALAASQRVSRAEIVRRAVERYIKRAEQKK